MNFINVGSWRPDLAPFESGFSNNNLNVVPSHLLGSRVVYRPTQNFAPFIAPISARPLGAFSFVNSNNIPSVYVGTEDKLLNLPAGASAFTNISSPVSALTGDNNTQWHFTTFDDFVIGTNGANKPTIFNSAGSALETFKPITSAPIAKYCATVREWLVVANTEDLTYGVRKQRVWWSAIGDPVRWPDPIAEASAAAILQSDFQDLLGTQGQITGIVPGLANADAAIFFERGIFRMLFGVFPFTFTFDAVEGARGTLSSKSLVLVGNVVYFFGEDGFYVFDGVSSQAIGNQKIDDYFITDLNKSYVKNIIGAVDPEKKLIYWAYPSNSSSDGLCDRIIIYNYQINEWSLVVEDTSYLFISETLPTTLEQLDSLYPTLEDIPFSLDDAIFAGGISKLTCFDHNFSMGYQSATNKAATLETGQFNQPLGKRGNIINSRVILDAFDDNFTVQVGYRDQMTNTWQWSNPVSPRDSGYVPHRKNSRFFKLRINILEGSSWNTFQGFEVQFGSSVSTK